MTAADAFNFSTQGGANDLARVIEACQTHGPYCLIGGLAVNCYVEPVYTLDADIVLISANLAQLQKSLEAQNFKVEQFEHSLNLQELGSDLRIQFTMDPRYQSFPARAQKRQVLGIEAMVASLEDLAQGKLWAYGDPKRRLAKRKKDELDLIRLAEAYPDLKRFYFSELLEIIERG